ncbi:hypothetical protein [Rhizobium azibense]|uniref:HNH endonuclease n=1 Tax=Rhizobium azibense TaxID=1136135 RepID=A0A4R3RHK4_9HYPH|nr:hypothetical protein [Rhizobium azibense]TCU34144.1 hypothetical protein EV129_113129 [Rhizobium azibense]
MAKAQGRCIFCGGHGLTKEHLWPKWMRPFLETDADPAHTNLRTRVQQISFMNAVTIDTPFDERQGYVFNKRLRVVCRGCNSGWMSSAESACKPMLTALINATPFGLDAPEQRRLALWSAIKTGVFERDDVSYASMTAAEYRHIAAQREPPPNWRIFLARYQGEGWRTRMFHRGMKVHAIGGTAPTSFNTQKTIIGMMNAVVLTVSSTADNAPTVVEKMSPLNMMQIWPFEQSIEWPTVTKIDDEQLRQLSYGYELGYF